jgi:hypothetical protein
MNNLGDKRRILLLLTEQSPLQQLWQVVEQNLAGTNSEVVALFINDERWHRAASLPFTREFSRLSGTHRDFTAQRAAELNQEMIGRVEARLRELATSTELQPTFEVLAEREASRIGNYVRVEMDLLVAPADFKKRKAFGELARLSCQILFVESEE